MTLLKNLGNVLFMNLTVENNLKQPVPSLFGIGTPKVYGEKIGRFALGLFSAKQAYRADPLIDGLLVSIPILSRSIAAQCWKTITAVTNLILLRTAENFEQDISSLKILRKIEEALETNTLQQLSLPGNDVEALSKFVERILNAPGRIDRLNEHLTFLNQDKLCKTLKILKDFGKLIEGGLVDSLQKKIEVLDHYITHENEQGSLDPEFKLTGKDYRILFLVSQRKKMLEALKQTGVNFASFQIIQTRLEKLDAINNSPVIRHLHRLCEQNCKSPQIFICDRFNSYEIRDKEFGFEASLKVLIEGRFSHVGIIVKDANGKMCISHVNAETNNHAVKVIQNPLFFAFSNMLELDISPLIPKQVAPEHTSILKDTFIRSFEQLSLEVHKDVPLSGNWRKLVTFLLGHKSFFSHSLEEVKFVPDHPQVCSSYVGIIFLQALHKVNLKLKELGYKEQIEDPFGTHEILDRVDVLRLIHLFEINKISRISPIHPTIAKVAAVPKLWDSSKN